MHSAGSVRPGSVRARGTRFDTHGTRFAEPPAVNFSGLIKAFDALVFFREATRRFTGADRESSGSSGAPPAPPTALTAPIEARLTGVVVAALKEAFDRDHARLELERAQLDDQRRRAEEALRLELRRQAVDRELARFRFIAATALVGWIAAVAVMVVRLSAASLLSRGLSALGWLLLLAALGSAMMAQGRVSAPPVSSSAAIDTGPAGAAALWLLIGGLAFGAAAILF